MPNARSSHVKSVPQLGGLGITIPAIFLCLLFGFMVLDSNEIPFMIATITSSILLVLVGIKDDIIGLPAWVKLISELAISLFFVVVTDIRIDTFHGIFGLYSLPLFWSYIYTLFVFIIIINSYNLIDGIDGLAGSLGVIILTCFLLYFSQTKAVFFILFSSTYIGGLMAFLRYNLSFGKFKIFMGDVGTIVIGFLLAIMATQVLSNDFTDTMAISNRPVFVLALFALPFLDTLRIFIIRGFSGNSPFLADKNHLHHVFLKFGFSHIQVTSILIVYCLSVIASAILFRHLFIHWHLLLTLLLSILLLVLLVWFFAMLNKNKE